MAGRARAPRRACFAIVISGLFSLSTAAQSPAENGAFARRNSFGVFAAYSNDSSRILLGTADQRKLVEFGANYDRRLLMNHVVNWQYSVELLPVALESDPLGRAVDHQISPTSLTQTYSVSPPLSCAPQTQSYSYVDSKGVTHTGTLTFFCHGREWTIGEAMSPVGFEWNFRPNHPLQPFLVGHGGYMYSTRPIPEPFAGSFNFTFDFGAGLELYRTRRQSVRAEYRYHHISNHGTASDNPGIDSGVFQVTYVFGR